MTDSNASWDNNGDNKTRNRLSQLFIFGSGYPRFSHALWWMWRYAEWMERVRKCGMISDGYWSFFGCQFFLWRLVTWPA